MDGELQFFFSILIMESNSYWLFSVDLSKLFYFWQILYKLFSTLDNLLIPRL